MCPWQEIFRYTDSIGFPFFHNQNYSKIRENLFASCPQAKSFACSGAQFKKALIRAILKLCPWQESNLHFILRRDVSYPLNDKSMGKTLTQKVFFKKFLFIDGGLEYKID